MKINPEARAAELRERLHRLLERGVQLSAVAHAAEPPIFPTDLSAFKGGARWGGNRLARLAVALEKLEFLSPVQVPEARPTDRAPPPEHDDQAEASEPALEPAS